VDSIIISKSSGWGFAFSFNSRLLFSFLSIKTGLWSTRKKTLPQGAVLREVFENDSQRSARKFTRRGERLLIRVYAGKLKPSSTFGCISQGSATSSLASKKVKKCRGIAATLLFINPPSKELGSFIRTDLLRNPPCVYLAGW